MNSILERLQLRISDNWLIEYDSQEFFSLTQQIFQQLSQFATPPTIFIAETDSFRFLASFLAAVAAKCQVFLCNPHWVEAEWQQVYELAQPDIVFGEIPPITPASFPSSLIPTAIMIPTGGSSGKVRFAIHTWETLSASVQGFCSYFEQTAIDSFCLLPLYHVSGLMQFLRSFLTKGSFYVASYASLKAGNYGRVNPQSYFISLVPTQLQYLLQDNPHWLSKFAVVLLGGAPAWEELLATARLYNIPLAPTYGMTETASQVVTLKPKDFLRGNQTNGKVLPHANLQFSKEGRITITADSLFWGYYPHFNPHRHEFLTDDLGDLTPDGYLKIQGRLSQKIITGGENVFPNEVEAAILATGLIQDVCVVGVAHPEWGEAIAAIYVPKSASLKLETLQKELANKISKYKHPKAWLSLKALPRNLQGKINYFAIKKLASELKIS